MKPDRVFFPADVVASKMASATVAFMPPSVPDSLANWVARARLLYGLPIEYLVPDASLLPAESIRFFFLDQAWTDRLIDGAFSVASFATWERLHTEVVMPGVRASGDEAQANLRRAFRVRRNSASSRPNAIALASSPTITGFLLRSRLVSAFPGMEVAARAVDDPLATPLSLLRLDRPYPDLMIALFNGIAVRVTLTEPAEAILPGVNSSDANNAYVGPKRLDGTGALTSMDATGKQLPIGAVALNAKGKLDIEAILSLQQKYSNVPLSSSSAAVAAALLDFPSQAAFHMLNDPDTQRAMPDPTPRPGEIA